MWLIPVALLWVLLCLIVVLLVRAGRDDEDHQ